MKVDESISRKAVLDILSEEEKKYNPVDQFEVTDAIGWLFERIRALPQEKQHPLPPIQDNEPISGRTVWFCPNCNEGIDKFAFGRNLSITHCPYCGQPITWRK